MTRIKKTAMAFAAATAMTAGGIGYGLHVQDRATPLSQCLSAQTPHANGAPVIVAPGFMTNDAYMSRLHDNLRARGYTVYAWGGGANTGPDAGDYAAFTRQLEAVYSRHNQKVALVGYSLGGVYARELARANPAQVSRVVTFGAPFGMRDDAGRVDAQVAAIYQMAHSRAPAGSDALTTPPPVPTLSVYSRSDAVVPWRFSQNAPAAHSYNLAVSYGHIAMPFNREAAAITAHFIAPTREVTPRFSMSPCQSQSGISHRP